MTCWNKFLTLDPKDRENADDFLNHPYFDEIRNIIESEIKELAELDQSDFKLFKQKKNARNDERQIISSALDFSEQERMNDEFKYEVELNKSQPDTESQYVSSESDKMKDFEVEIDAISQSDISDREFNEQSDLIEKYFDIDSQNPAQGNFNNEIKEESESSDDSIKKINTTDNNVK